MRGKERFVSLDREKKRGERCGEGEGGDGGGRRGGGEGGRRAKGTFQTMFHYVLLPALALCLPSRHPSPQACLGYALKQALCTHRSTT